MKKPPLLLFISILLGLSNSIGQTPTEQPSVPSGRERITVMAVVIDGDTMLMRNLPMVLIKEKRTFKSRKQAIRYTRLVRNVKKVYPYSQAAASLLKQYNDQLAQIEDTKKRKRLMRQAEDELKAEYGAELRQLTFSQGMILIKLIDRETGHTSYELVKDLRGNFSAFLWQSFSRLFGINLKTRYNSDGEDQRIEDIVLLIKRGEI